MNSIVHRCRAPILSAVLAVFCLLTVASGHPNRLLAIEPNEPRIAAASEDGERAISRMKVPAGLKVQLWAAEPMLANPVAFCFDERGRVYVAETFRQKKGVEDNRDHSSWLDDDLAAETIDDRLAYFKKHLGDKIQDYAKEQDRIRLLEDRDGDGRADNSTIFADGFHDVLDGTGAGVLARGKNVWYTNIPNLWLLSDDDGDGKADERRVLHRGFGVRVAFRGHDLHGLTMGPDGRLYFSCGDRGLNVTTPEGKKLVYPDRGAVLRCNPDGSELEVFATGLRNPQELAFDQFGNLFTCDNNSDSGDKARWVYLVEGGESGWRMSFQYLSDRGPWNREKLWHPQHEGQPAYIVPPIANISDGPSGLAYYPGVGLPEKYDDHFFLVDFRGGFANSGVRSFAVKPKGASFELVDSQEFLWSILGTDADFGPDGALYVCDWVETWEGVGKGRIYRVSDPAVKDDPLVREVPLLLREGFSQRSNDELVKLLAHRHRQVRLEAQFALAERGDKAPYLLARTATINDNRLARLHAIWALGQIERKLPGLLDIVVLPLLADADAEIRAQSAKVLGEAGINWAAEKLAGLFKDPEPRVRFFAALAYSHMGRSAAIAPILELLRDNADRDAYLRHAAVMALAALSEKEVLSAADDISPAVRMGVLLALRRAANPELARFLNDADPRLVDEAARAINDVPVNEAMPQLAALAGRKGLSESTLYRVINANFRVNAPGSAKAVAAIAADSSLAEGVRLEAVAALGDWGAPSGRDRVMGLWRPLAKRDGQPATEAFRSNLTGIFSGGAKVPQVAARVATKLEIREVGPVLQKVFADMQQPVQMRVEALEALSRLGDAGVHDAMELALVDREAQVRVAGRRALARVQPEAALDEFSRALDSGEIVEKQSALAMLGEIKGSGSAAILTTWLDKALAGEVPLEIQLDLVEAAAKRPLPQLQQRLKKMKESASGDDPLTPYRIAQSGGNAERGRRLFFERSDLSCVRCHKVGDRGGEVGPDLSKIAGQQKPEYLLESLVLPDRQIAKGFDPVVIVTENGKVHAGTIREETEREVRLMNAEGAVIAIPKSEIEERARGRSAMPEDLVKKMSLFDLRDLVAFLAELK